jgi:hypothetical protein
MRDFISNNVFVIIVVIISNIPLNVHDFPRIPKSQSFHPLIVLHEYSSTTGSQCTNLGGLFMALSRPGLSSLLVVRATSVKIWSVSVDMGPHGSVVG